MRRIKLTAIVIIVVLILVNLFIIPLNQVHAASRKPFVPNPTASPAPSNPIQELPDPVNEETEQSIKYIFIVIGDGMGEAHLELGNLFKKVVTGDMSNNAVWENFPVQITAKGGVESAQGSSMIATGEKNPAGLVSQRKNGLKLTTILDIAMDNGLSTGIVTLSTLADATPACFYSHSSSRRNYHAIANQIPDSNIDFIAGGGLELMFKNLPKEFLKDSMGDKVNSKVGRHDIANQMELNGYTNYLGLSGALDFLESDIAENKSFCVFNSGDVPFYYLQRTKDNSELSKNVPSLPKIVSRGINSLSKDEDGFFMVIEEPSIDKAGHYSKEKYVALEMGVLDKTLDVIYEFYEEHPTETLIILTADHETGDHRFVPGAVDELVNIKEVLPWNESPDKISSYLKEFFDAEIKTSYLETGNSFIKNNTFGNEFDNRAYAAANITAKISSILGMGPRIARHSSQPIPILAMGNDSSLFETCESLADIPHVICDIMDWDNVLGTEISD